MVRTGQGQLARNFQEIDVYPIAGRIILQRYRILLQMHSAPQPVFPKIKFAASCSNLDHRVANSDPSSRRKSIKCSLQASANCTFKIIGIEYPH